MPFRSGGASERPNHRGHLWVIGHRGSPTREPENTIASFERALREGANGLELDLCVTCDGDVALWHDDDPDESRARFRQLGLEPVVRYRPRVPADRAHRRPVHELTLADLRAHFGYSDGLFGGPARVRIPDLGEFVEWASRQPTLGLVFLDVKIPGERDDLIQILVRRLDDLVALHRPRFRIVLESALAVVAAGLARYGARYAHALDVEPPAGVVTDFERCSAARAAVAAGMSHVTAQRPRGITLFPFATHRRIVEADLVRIQRHNETSPDVPIEGLCSFTINVEREMRTLVELGVWGIQSDRPSLLRRVAIACGRTVDVG